jgi:hypothetical protein
MTTDDERTYSKSEIRERRRELSQRLALQQRQLDALAKMDEAADELDQVERELAALDRGGAEPEQPADAVPPEPQMTGERAVVIMRDDHPDTWLPARDVLTGMVKRGWSKDKDSDLALQSLRHSLRRLALHNDHVERKTEGAKHFYRYVTRLGSDVPVPSVRVNGVAVPAHQGGLSDG